MPLVVQQLAVEDRGHLVHGIRHQEAAVEDGDLRLFLGKIFAVDVDGSRHGRLLQPQRAAFGRMDAGGVELERGLAVLGQQQRAVEVRDLRPLRDQHRRRHGKRGAHHAPHHHLIALGARGVAQGQRLGQPAGLVELDVDHVVAALQRGQRGPVMAALVRADGHDALHLGQRLVAARGQRLLHHRHAQPLQRRRQLGVFRHRPALVRVDDDAGVGGARAHRLQPGHIALAAQLDLQQRPEGVLRGLAPHRVGLGQRQGVGGDHRAGLRQPRKLPDAGPGALGLQIPQRAVHGVAAGAGVHPLQQRLPGQAREVQRLDLGDHALGRLVVAGVRRAFSPTPDLAVRHLHGDHGLLGARPARDGEGLPQPEDLPLRRQPQAHASASTSRLAPWR